MKGLIRGPSDRLQRVHVHMNTPRAHFPGKRGGREIIARNRASAIKRLKAIQLSGGARTDAHTPVLR